jgi:2-haloacid dehalogenase
MEPQAPIRALTFDTGGTILDWYEGVKGTFERVGSRRGVVADWDTITRDYRRRSIETMLGSIGPRFNIDDVHRHVLSQLIDEFGLDLFTDGDRDELCLSWHELDAWPDFPKALSRMREKYTVVSFTILSTALVLDVSKRNRIDWDCIITGEMLGVYKTHPESYRTAAKILALDPQEIVMVACHNFDLLAARKEGYRSAFVRRPSEWGPQGPPDPTPADEHDFIADDFGQLADQLGV